MCPPILCLCVPAQLCNAASRRLRRTTAAPPPPYTLHPAPTNQGQAVAHATGAVGLAAQAAAPLLALTERRISGPPPTPHPPPPHAAPPTPTSRRCRKMQRWRRMCRCMGGAWGGPAGRPWAGACGSQAARPLLPVSFVPLPAWLQACCCVLPMARPPTPPHTPTPPHPHPHPTPPTLLRISTCPHCCTLGRACSGRSRHK